MTSVAPPDAHVEQPGDAGVRAEVARAVRGQELSMVERLDEYWDLVADGAST